jgi:hypothetical protein
MFSCAAFTKAEKFKVKYKEVEDYNKQTQLYASAKDQSILDVKRAERLLPLLNPFTFAKLCRQAGTFGDVEKLLTPILGSI